MARSKKSIRNRANRRRAEMIEEAITAGHVTAAEDRAWLQERKAARWRSMRKQAEHSAHKEGRYLHVPYAEKAKALGAPPR
jgi:hypothetical protein